MLTRFGGGLMATERYHPLFAVDLASACSRYEAIASARVFDLQSKMSLSVLYRSVKLAVISVGRWFIGFRTWSFSLSTKWSAVCILSSSSKKPNEPQDEPAGLLSMA
jgi:hypothetical protein